MKNYELSKSKEYLAFSAIFLLAYFALNYVFYIMDRSVSYTQTLKTYLPYTLILLVNSLPHLCVGIWFLISYYRKR